jgi:hypothetical protein
VRKYLRDPDKEVRGHAAAIARMVAHRHPALEIRREAMRMNLDVMQTDPDPMLRADIAKTLAQSSLRDDFTDEMRQEIAALVQKPDHLTAGTYLGEQVILLAGVADAQSATPRLRQLAGKGSFSAQLALARLGDPAATQYVIGKVESAGSRLGHFEKPLHYLAFTRQPAAVAVIIKYLFIEGSSTPSFDTGSVPFALDAARALDGVVEGFPSTLAFGDTVARSREWVTKQGGVANLKIRR